MTAPKRPAFPLQWELNGSEKWGWDIRLRDDADNTEIVVCPDDPGPFSWRTTEEARAAVAVELRRLAAAIERGEP